MSKEELLAAPATQSSPLLSRDIGDVHVENLATALARRDYRLPRHRHTDLFQFFWIQHGEADCQTDTQFLKLYGPGLLVVPAKVSREFSFSANSTGCLISISQALLHAFERISGDEGWLGVLSQVRWIPQNPEHNVHECANKMWLEFSSASDHRLHVTASALTFVSSLVATCEPEVVADEEASEAQQLVVDAFLTDIESHYASRDTIADYCKRLGVTERTLRRATTACLQQTPILIVHKRKCLEAQRLLRFTSLSIAEIAYNLGFSEPSYFSRRFKQLTGKVPRDIRP